MNNFFDTPYYKDYLNSYATYCHNCVDINDSKLEEELFISTCRELGDVFENKEDKAVDQFVKLFDEENRLLLLSDYINDSIKNKDHAKLYFLVSVIHSYDVGNLNEALQNLIIYLVNKKDLNSIEFTMLERVIDEFSERPEKVLISVVRMILKITNNEERTSYLTKASYLLVP